MNFYFAASKVCNLRCKYCYVPEYNKTKQKQYDQRATEAATAFVQKAKAENMGLHTCCLHGAECTILSPETLGGLVNLFFEHTLRPVRIQTNGVSLTSEYLDRLLKVIHNPSKFHIGFSIDGPESIHNANRKNTWKQVSTNFFTAVQKGFEAGILSVINAATIANLDDFGDWNMAMDKFGVKRRYKLAEHGFELTPDENMIFAKWLLKTGYWRNLQAFIPMMCIHQGNDCFFFEFDIDGKTYTCNKNFEDSKSFGNWQDAPFDALIKKRRVYNQDKYIHPDCSTCEYWERCRGGCPTTRTNGKSVDCAIKKYIWDQFKIAKAA